MALTLEEFIVNHTEMLVEFALDYKKNNAKYPEQYPLTMVDGNEGLWGEMFDDFHDRGWS
jgi:hypothetical protein